MPDPDRATFTNEVEERLETLRQKFQEMELSQMRKGEMEARAKLADAKKEIDRKRQSARQKLHEARKASENAWADLKEGLGAALTELSDAVERAHRSFEGIEEEEDADAEAAGV